MKHVSKVKLSAAAACALLSFLAVADPIWQQSQSPQIELGIRDRNPSGEYSVLFVVTGPSGQKSTISKQVIGDQWSSVLFPQSFAGDLLPGKYEWSGYVNGKVAVGGRFAYEVTGRTSRLTIIRLRDHPR